MNAGAARTDTDDEPPGIVHFRDVQRVLTLFAQAVSGHPVMLEPLDDDPGAASSVGIAEDGEVIHLPASVATFATAAHNRGSYRVSVLHQAGYFQFGTFTFDLDAVTGSPVPRAAGDSRSDLERFFGASPSPGLLRRVFATVEDHRIDSAVRRHYPGARADLGRVLAHALAGREPVAHGSPTRWLVEALVRYSLGESEGALVASDRTGTCALVLHLAASVEAAGATVHDSARAAAAICAAIATAVPSAPRPPLRTDGLALEPIPEPTAEESSAPSGFAADDGDGEATPSEDDLAVGFVDFRGELRTDLVYRQTSEAGGGTVLDETSSTDTTEPTSADDRATDTGTERRPARWAPPATPATGADRSFLYDEWDYTAPGYLRSWCHLKEHRLRGDDFDFIGDVRRRHAVLAAQVRRRFSFMRPEAWQRVHRTTDGDELELDAVIDAVVDRRSGRTADDRLYMRRDRARREVATAFLVDLSASTGAPIVPLVIVPHRTPDAPTAIDYPYLADEDEGSSWGPPEPQRRIIDIAKDSLALMCDALQVLGDQHAVYGFSGSGRHDVEFYVAKDFDDDPSPRTWAALAAMEPRRYTRMGPAIRHATTKIVAEAMRTKLLIVVSDGYPQDSDYGPERRDKEYGLQDTARALQEAENAGVATFLVTIDPAGNDYLRRMCPEHRYLVIDDVTALPGELAKLYRSLTASVGSFRPAAHLTAR